MAEDMVLEVLKRIQAEVAGSGQRMDKIEQHLTNLERRQTAAMHFEKQVLAHLAGIHESVDELRADMRQMRLELRDVHNRLDRVEAR